MDKLKIILVASIVIILVTIGVIVYIVVSEDSSVSAGHVTQVKPATVQAVSDEEYYNYSLEQEQPMQTRDQVDVIEAGALAGYHLYEGHSFTPTRIYVMIPHYDIDPTKFIINIRNMVGYFDNYWYFDQSRYSLCIIEDYAIHDGMLFINDEYVLNLQDVVSASVKDPQGDYVASSEAADYVVESSISTDATVPQEPGNYTDDAGQPYIVTEDNQVIKGHYCTTEADIVYYGVSCGYEVYSGSDYTPEKWADLVVNAFPSDLTNVTTNIRDTYGNGPLDHAWYYDDENKQIVILRGALYYENNNGFEILSGDYVRLDSFV